MSKSNQSPKPNGSFRKLSSSLRISNNATRIIKKSTRPKLAPRAKGELTYHVGHNDISKGKDKSLHLRVTENTGGGFFSNEWIGLEEVVRTIEVLDSDGPFKAVTFIPLYESSSSNNHGFLAAALRSEDILETVDGHPLSHALGDVKAFRTAMSKLIKQKVDLPDEVAGAEAIREAKREEMIERMKSAAKEREDAPQSK